MGFMDTYEDTLHGSSSIAISRFKWARNGVYYKGFGCLGGLSGFLNSFDL